MNPILDDLRELLVQGTVSTQEELCETLAALGHAVTQSKVSRMLRKVGAVKAKNESGQIVYRLAREPAPPTTDSQLVSLVIDIVANEAMIIINTSPGAAQLIARILDFHKDSVGLLGTIAGDDAVLVIPKSTRNTRATLAKIKQLLLNAPV